MHFSHTNASSSSSFTELIGKNWFTESLSEKEIQKQRIDEKREKPK